MKINLNHTAKLETALSEGQGKATARLLTVYDLESAVVQTEKTLEKVGITKGLWKGTTVLVNPHRLPNAYKHTAETSMAVLERGANAWFLIHVYRTYCGKISSGASSMPPQITLPHKPEAILAGILRANHMDLAVSP